MTGLELAWGLSPLSGSAILSAAALAGAAGGALLAARGRAGAARAAVGVLYGLGAATLAAAALSPAAVVVREDRAKPRVVLLVDRSASMNERDMPGGASRWDSAAALAAEGSDFRNRLERAAHVQALAFDERVRPLAADEVASPPSGPATDISGALESALSTPGVGDLAAILMISDGRHTVGLPPEMAAQALTGRRVPIWTIGLGQAGAIRPRLRVLGLEVPETAPLNAEVAVTATIVTENLTGRRLDVRLRIDGAVVAQQELPVAQPSERFPVRFEVQARPEGVRRVELLVLAGEGLSARAVRHMIVLSSPARMLYAEGRLGWGYREMVRALSATSGRSPELWAGFLPPEARGGSADAGLAGRLGALDVVVLGDVTAAELGDRGATALARAVREDGCGLLFMASPACAATYRGTPLEALLPVDLGYETLPGPAAGTAPVPDRKVELVGDAAAAEPLRLAASQAENHRLWSSLVETDSGWRLGAPRQGAEVWLRAGSEPVLVAWKAGAGRVAVLDWPDHWRWARSSGEGAEAHRRFFSRLALWLSGRDAPRGEKLALSLASYRLAPGEDTSLLARLLKAPPAVPVEVSVIVRPTASGSRKGTGTGSDSDADRRNDGRALRVSPVGPGLYRTSIRAGAPGEYRAEVAVRSGSADWAKGELFFSVEGHDAESEDPTPDFPALAAVSKATGGRFLPPAEAARAPELLAKVLPEPPPRVRRVKTLLWDRLWLLWTGLASFCGAWVILRRGR